MTDSPAGPQVDSWNGRIERVPDITMRGDEKPSNRKRVFDYCLHPPSVWASESNGGCTLHCNGWVRAPDADKVLVKIQASGQAPRIVRLFLSRPDVYEHYRRAGYSITEFSGFHALIDVEAAGCPDTLVNIQILLNGSTAASSLYSPLKLYSNHRASLGHDMSFYL